MTWNGCEIFLQCKRNEKVNAPPDLIRPAKKLYNLSVKPLKNLLANVFAQNCQAAMNWSASLLLARHEDLSGSVPYVTTNCHESSELCMMKINV